jgi:hypothetical protein
LRHDGAGAHDALFTDSHAGQNGGAGAHEAVAADHHASRKRSPRADVYAVLENAFVIHARAGVDDHRPPKNCSSSDGGVGQHLRAFTQLRGPCDECPLVDCRDDAYAAGAKDLVNLQTIRAAAAADGGKAAEGRGIVPVQLLAEARFPPKQGHAVNGRAPLGVVVKECCDLHALPRE